MPFVINSLGDRMYGFWTLIGTFLGYYGLIDFGLSSAVNRYISEAVGAQDSKKCNNIFNTALVLFSILGVIALALSLWGHRRKPWFQPKAEFFDYGVSKLARQEFNMFEINLDEDYQLELIPADAGL